MVMRLCDGFELLFALEVLFAGLLVPIFTALLVFLWTVSAGVFVLCGEVFLVACTAGVASSSARFATDFSDGVSDIGVITEICGNSAPRPFPNRAFVCLPICPLSSVACPVRGERSELLCY